jgi:hypothetical protein
MTPEQAAHETARAIVAVPARFMMDAATYARGGELGFDGIDFYIAGRAGVLGDVPAAVAAAALVFFAPETIEAAWDRTAPVMPRREAATEWAAAGHEWSRAHLGDDVDWARVADVAGVVVQGASVAVAPLFAAWRTLPEPADDKPRALHRLNALRELRGALHAAAIITVGLSPCEAVAVRSPKMAAGFGWTEPLPDVEPLRDRWQLAESRTDRMMGRHYRSLTVEQRTEFVDLLAHL